MDFSNIVQHSPVISPITISTFALSTDSLRSICMIGGLNGEFAYKSLLGCTDVVKSNPTVMGHITTASSAVTNHIDIPSHPNCPHRAIIASNDAKIRTLDLTTGEFLHHPSRATHNGTASGHTYPFPLNCTASCPDGRLAVAIGDSPTPLILRSDTGAIERTLPGHSDHGFACAWSPDARYVATAAQDRLINIYDARMWRVVSCFSSHVSTVRNMRFSPVGGGPRCLVLCEEADRVTVVDARGWEGSQTHEFYGGVVGCDFEGDGGGFWVANCDSRFGGFMRWERGGGGQESGLGFVRKGAEWDGEEDWIAEEKRVSDARCVDPMRSGRRWNL
jgi:WD40 repeat protein